MQNFVSTKSDLLATKKKKISYQGQKNKTKQKTKTKTKTKTKKKKESNFQQNLACEVLSIPQQYESNLESIDICDLVRKGHFSTLH